MSFIFIIILVGLLPSSSLAGFRSWFCGTCSVCQVCPPCSPQVNVVPQCECRESLNNCNCQCLTQQNLHEYHLQWYSHLSTSYNNTYATQMNHHHVNRRLLLSLWALLFINLILLLLLGALIFFAPSLLRRWSHWKTKSRTQRRSRLQKQLTRLEDITPTALLPTDPLYSISHDLNNHRDLLRTLTQQLQSGHVAHSPPSNQTEGVY